MPLTDAQARRALRRADIPWADDLKDPRDSRNQRHDHLGLLGLLVTAFSCGRTRLRRVEELSEDLSRGVRRQLGIRGRVSDTTLYRLLSSQGTAGLRETLRAFVRKYIEAKVIAKDRFPIGVVSVDGKSFWTSTVKCVDGAKTSVDEKSGVMTASVMSLRAVLSSSRVTPCLDFEVIGDKQGEAPGFRELFPRVVEEFGGQFEVVTADAGLTCRENAEQVNAASKYYVFALKGNQPKLYALAEQMFRDCPGGLKAKADEPRNGALEVRELHTITVKGMEQVDLAGATQLWRVRKQSTRLGGTQSDTEVRYFITNLPPTRLSPTQQLSLVRLHWEIENSHNWTMDVALSEDDVQPCQSSRTALEVVAWLRVIAYNLVSAWRAQAAQRDLKPMPWVRAMEQLRDAFVSFTDGAPQPTLL